MNVELLFALLPTAFAFVVVVMIAREVYAQKIQSLKVIMRNTEFRLEVRQGEIRTLCRAMVVSQWDRNQLLKPMLNHNIEDLKRALVLDLIPQVTIEERMLHDRGLIEYVATINTVI